MMRFTEFGRKICLLFAFFPILAFSNWFSNHEDLVIEQVVEYLSTHPLSPLIEGGPSHYIPLGFSEQTGKDIAFPMGKIEQGDASYAVMFSARKHADNVEVRLLCITKDHMPSPLLFADVLALLPKVEIPQCHVFVEQLELLPEDQILERWVFFNPEESREFHILTSPDGEGGTYFAILRE